MADENQAKESWRERLGHTYRLVIMRDESFEEVGSYRLTRLNIYLMVSTLIVSTAIFVMLLFVLTPLKRLLPGYGDVSYRDEAEELAQAVQELQERNRANEVYIQNIQKLFAGDFETEADIPQADSSDAVPDSLLNLEPIAEDGELRNAVERNQPLVPSEGPEPPPAAEYSPYRTTPLEQLYLIAPIKGEISNGFQQDKGHLGADILAPRNSPIKSIMDGVVIQSDWTLETGNTIAVQHANNVVSFYKHNSALLKKVGDGVRAGEAIAIIGNTGTLSSGPHLHFELWYNGRAVDPEDYIRFN